MTQRCEIVLDSYRLAKYSEQVYCYICDGANAFDAEYCRHCQAPMALSHQADSCRQGPQMIAVLGPSGVGKTVYLGMLMDMLSRQSDPLSVAARGAFSISLQQHTTAALAAGEFPSKTPNEPDQWNWVHCLVRSKGRRRDTELIMPDMAGEAIIEEMEHPQSFPVIRALLERCDGAMVLVDTIKLQEGHREQEHFALKVLSFLSELNADPKAGWAAKPVAVVFSKADQCDRCFDDPEEFARQHAPGVWNRGRDRFSKLAFFASGVAGACAFRTSFDLTRRRIPLRVEPRGIDEPFAWIVESLKPAKKS